MLKRFSFKFDMRSSAYVKQKIYKFGKNWLSFGDTEGWIWQLYGTSKKHTCVLRIFFCFLGRWHTTVCLDPLFLMLSHIILCKFYCANDNNVYNVTIGEKKSCYSESALLLSYYHLRDYFITVSHHNYILVLWSWMSGLLF